MKPNIKQIAPWILYDFANTPFPTIVLTFVFSTFFTKFIAKDQLLGTSLWGAGLAISGIIIGIFSPILGAIADQSGRKKPWIFAFALTVILSSFALAFTPPELNSIYKILMIVMIGNCALNFAQVFYNSLLVQVAPTDMIGRISGIGWGCSYFGGLICLVITLVFLIPKNDDPQLLAWGVKQSLILVGLWFLVFSMPLFLFFQEKKGKNLNVDVVRSGIKQLIDTIKSIKEYKMLLGFLFAFFFYSDGITTLLNFGGIYAATVLGFSFNDVMIFAVSINVVAGIGAIIFGLIDDKIGPAKLIIFCIAIIALCCLMIISFEKALIFWIFGLILGIFIGPLQSASRSMLAQIVPKEKITEMFGIYALTGKLSTFIGPLIVSLITYFFKSNSVGMYVVLVMLTLGLILMLQYFDYKFKKFWLFFWRK